MSAPVPGTLARFQDAFAQALFEPAAGAIRELAALADQPAFAVYRNTVMKGCIDALRANYPAVARLVGEEWFRAAAAIYVRDAPPAEPSLLRYGASFPEFLARFGPAADLPYLPGVARLDRYWTQAHAGPDEAALEPAAVAHLAPEALARTVLHPHATARWASFPDAPIYSIWSRNRGDEAPDGDLHWRAEGVLIVRPEDVVQWRALDAAGCAFLDICGAGGVLGEAAQAALEAQADVDLARLMSVLLEAGAFGRMTPDCNPRSTEGQR